jgi:hypothetical protein
MAKATFSVLSESDKQLVLEAEPKALKKLDEDELIALHARVRRARNKHVKLYRREAGAQVKADASRGAASKKSRRNAARAEVLEETLARVSRRLAAAARASADELRTERLAQAKGSTATKPSKKGGTAAKKKPAGTSKAKAATRTPRTEKVRGSAKGADKRRQAKRDKR